MKIRLGRLILISFLTEIPHHEFRCDSFDTHISARLQLLAIWCIVFGVRWLYEPWVECMNHLRPSFDFHSFVSVPILFSKGMRWHLGGTVKENSFNLVQACIVWFLDFWHVGVGGLSEFYSPLVFFSGFPCFQQLPHFTMIRIWMDIGSGGLWENQAIWFEDRRVHCNLCILDPSIPSGFGSRGETKSTQWEYQNVYIFLTYFDNEDCPGLICNFALIFVIGLSLWHRGADVSTLERRNPSM